MESEPSSFKPLWLLIDIVFFEPYRAAEVPKASLRVNGVSLGKVHIRDEVILLVGQLKQDPNHRMILSPICSLLDFFDDGIINSFAKGRIVPRASWYCILHFCLLKCNVASDVTINYLFVAWLESFFNYFLENENCRKSAQVHEYSKYTDRAFTASSQP